MASDAKTTRRRYGKDLKARILDECSVAGASVAQVAMSHGINANVVHRWRQLAQMTGAATVAKPREFVPVTVASPATAIERRQPIEVELHRGSLMMKITWPASSAADFTVWTRELLR